MTLTVRKNKEILRLKWHQYMSAGQVEVSVGLSHSTVGEYLRKAKQANLIWKLTEMLSEEPLREKLFPPKLKVAEVPLPDWTYVEKEFKLPAVNDN
jgi:hypothetical protein